ncbi:MAG: VCBS repeat-containing protein [Rhodothermia bacterium]|nr:VCBS repeat-containing protein [Rhodothermia bacterium]
MIRLLVSVSISLMLGWQNADAQPFEIPSPNVPADVQGLSPAITVGFGTLEWADYNGDGNFDFLLLGRLPSTGASTIPLFGDVFRSSPTISLNPPGLVYAFFINRTIERLWLSDADWDDFDRDGDLDLVTIGASTINAPYAPQAILYVADGNTLSRMETDLTGLHSGAVRWGDLDNDGVSDLAMIGVDASGSHRTLVYRGDGTGNFTPVPFGGPRLAYGSLEWLDYDVDGDSDLFVVGLREDGGAHAAMYRNDGGVLVEMAQSFRGVAYGKIAVGDFDSDSDPDILVSGQVNSHKFGSGLTTLYRNDNGGFAVVDTDLPDVYFGDAVWADYDRDGDLDVVIAGRRETFGSRLLRACVQEPQAVFDCSPIQTAGLGGQPAPGLSYGAVSMVDYDSDSDLDLMVTGMPRNSEYFTTLYKSLSGAQNSAPLPPDGLTSSTDPGGRVSLSWNPAIDPNTPSSGLTYELRVGTSPGGIDVMAPRADPQSGDRRVVEAGREGSGTSWGLVGLSPGTYYWSVQAVDNSFAGSAFAAEQSFMIGN